MAKTALACLLLCSALLAWSQEPPFADEPAWLSYERGIALYRDGEYGRALQLFRDAISKGAPFPEAEVGVGMVHEAESAYDLARRQYQSALEKRQFFRVAEREYQVLYRLARIHARERNYLQYKETLQKVVADDELFSDDQYEQLRTSYRTTLSSDGLNRLIVLYRQQNQFALEAHRELGVFFVRSGRYDKAVDHLLFAVLKTMTVAVEYMREQVPEYEFTTISRLLGDMNGMNRLEEYIDYSQLYRTLYFLADGLYGAERTSGEAQNLWRLLADRDDTGEWGQRAARQLRNPSLKPDIETELSGRWTKSSYEALASTTSKTSTLSSRETR